MSECAGGFVITCVGAAIGVTALTVGTLFVGTGYLACRGGYRAIKAGKEAWDTHLKKLEKERLERFKQLRKADRSQIDRLNENFLLWAQEGQKILCQRESKVKQQLVKNQAQILEEERKRTEASAAWERIALLDEELKAFREDNLIVPSLNIKEADRKKYQNQLNKARKELQNKANHLEQSQINDIDLIRISPLQEPGTQIDELTKESKEVDVQLAVLRGEIASLIFLSEKDRAAIQKKVDTLESKIKNKTINEGPDLKKALTNMQNYLKTTKDKEAQNRRAWQEAQEIYFSLNDRYTTASQDLVLKEIIATPLEDLTTYLEKTKPLLLQISEDPQQLLTELKIKKKSFDEKVNKDLLDHQKVLNQHMKKALEKALDRLGYTDTKIEEKDGTVKITGKGSKKNKKAKVSFSLSNDGYFTVDLSAKGFKNQKTCTKEFYRIQQALNDLGIQVELKEHQKTWMTEMVNFIKDQLINMGYPEDSITQETIDSGEQILAYHGRDKKTEIIIDGKSGELIKTEGPGVTEIKTRVTSLEQDEIDDDIDEVINVSS